MALLLCVCEREREAQRSARKILEQQTRNTHLAQVSLTFFGYYLENKVSILHCSLGLTEWACISLSSLVQLLFRCSGFTVIHEFSRRCRDRQSLFIIVIFLQN